MSSVETNNLNITEKEFFEEITKLSVQNLIKIHSAICDSFNQEISKEVIKTKKFTESLFRFIEDNNLEKMKSNICRLLKRDNELKVNNNNLELLKQSFEDVLNTDSVL
jgi:uncharacterized protein YacL (UPF0231 family)